MEGPRRWIDIVRRAHTGQSNYALDLVVLVLVLPQALVAQSSGAITMPRAITCTYDPLNRLTDALYSTGEAFKRRR